VTSEPIKFNYFYGNQAEQFSFYRIPKRLFTDPTFSQLSSDAKVLYGLMLDRMSLSLKHEWKDEKNRVFIYFTLLEVQELMNCGHNKGVRLMAELDDEKGIGLIERVKQGLGKPARIYVKNFLGLEQKECQLSDDPNEVINQEVKTSEKGKSGVPEKGSQDFSKEEAINTDKNNTEKNKPEANKSNLSILLSHQKAEINLNKEIDRWMEYRDIFKRNIDYETLIKQDQEKVAEILELLIETACSHAKTYRINGSNIPSQLVKERLLDLNFFHIQYVLETLNENTSKVQNIKAYLLATLYNAKNTINTYYQSRVNHDLYGKYQRGG
jgi:hypothetical protein